MESFHPNQLDNAVHMMKDRGEESIKATLPMKIGKTYATLIYQQVQGYCFLHDIELKTEEKKGILSNRFLFMLNGQAQDIGGLLEHILQMKKDLKK